MFIKFTEKLSSHSYPLWVLELICVHPKPHLPKLNLNTHPSRDPQSFLPPTISWFTNVLNTFQLQALLAHGFDTK